MATQHGVTGCPLNRGLDILTEDTEHTDIDNDSTHSSDLTRERNDLCHRVAAREGQPAEAMDCIQQELQYLSITIHQPQPPASAEPFGEVLCQYTDTLCSTQKQSNLTNSLIQDIPVFNEHDSTKLEDWLLHIETTADLTSKSRARLTKAKSQGLMHTLVTEVISSNRSRDEIKDLLRMKFCNADILTYT